MSCVCVALATDDSATREQWGPILVSAGFRVVLANSRHAMPDSAAKDAPAPDIVVWDARADMDWPKQWREAHQRGETALVVVGDTQGGDVSLPSDFTPREMILACELLGRLVGLRREHREAKRTHQDLQRLALTDPLTELPNRRAWVEQLAFRQRTALTEGRSLCLAILDLDQFKQVNEFHGYAEGDRVLQAVAASLADQVRQGDFVARLGGDEFGLLVSEVALPVAEQIVNRLRAGLRRQTAEMASHGLTASAGFAVGRGAAVENLFAVADRSVRQAKSAGRDQAIGAEIS